MSTWVDFKDLRAKLRFDLVLEHYQVKVKSKGRQHMGYCPLPNHNGKRNSPSFSANLERGIFHCFGCGAKGNLLEFAALMERVSPEDGNGLRAVALDLQRRFCPGFEMPHSRINERPNPEIKDAPPKLVVVNAPLDFELKDLDAKHPYLRNRGFNPLTIGHFGLGFCSRGLLKDRIAIPLHDERGRLIGYAGRVVDDSAITEDNPRYRLPGSRKRNELVHEFRKTLLLYNSFRTRAPVDDLYVVEGFPSVWWLFQNALPNAVSTIGADCSERQAELIVSLVKPAGRIWIISDGDDAGERFGTTALLQVAAHRLARWVKLERETQPTDYRIEQLHQLLKA